MCTYFLYCLALLLLNAFCLYMHLNWSDGFTVHSSGSCLLYLLCCCLDLLSGCSSGPPASFLHHLNMIPYALLQLSVTHRSWDIHTTAQLNTHLTAQVLQGLSGILGLQFRDIIISLLELINFS